MKRLPHILSAILIVGILAAGIETKTKPATAGSSRASAVDLSDIRTSTLHNPYR